MKDVDCLMTASEAAARIRSGEITSEQLVSACLDRIAERERLVGAWAWLGPDAALAAARAADRSSPGGALHGVPIGVKDIMDTFDMPTGHGFSPYANHRPAWDAFCVAACRRAGAIVLGKTVTTEFAYFAAGKTRNPHDFDATPGGSSSGSAAAVADGMVPLAFGSQTAASLIRPAAFCGVVGYKASQGEFSLSGMRPFSESLDSLGVLARSVDDVSLVRDVWLGRPAASSSSRFSDGRMPRLGFCRTGQWSCLDEQARTAAEEAVQRLSRAGAGVRDIELPPEFSQIVDAHRTIMAYEAARNYLFEYEHFQDRLSKEFLALCAQGLAVARESYFAAKHLVSQSMAVFTRLFEGFDAWVAPSALGEAPLAKDGTGDPLMSRLWTALGAPAVAIPAARGRRGLPLGVQLVGPRSCDDRLIEAGRWAAEKLGPSS